VGPTSERTAAEQTASRRRRNLRRLRRRLGALLIPRVAPPLLKLLARTWRVEQMGMEHLALALESPGRLATLWHGRMLLPLPLHRGAGHAVLVSPSSDGSLAALLLERFGYRVVRGSSSKEPARALRELLTNLTQGGTIVITPDGPRGPRHSVNAGPPFLASATGFPIVPVGCAASAAWRLASWDRFTIPRPFARVAIVYGELLFVPRRASAPELQQASEEMGVRIRRAELQGFARLGREQDW
jgi:lysophospholipid acyltransferase (LPLAT)-like uncharacterized protein